MVKARPRVAIIGGGLFGVTAAFLLAPDFEVHLFESSGELLRGATWANHGRQHFGFHYPRSLATARQCLDSHRDFREFYGEAEVADFPNFYAVAREGSRVTPDQYLQFCHDAGLTYERQTPPAGFLENEKLALCLRVQEGVLDYSILRETILARLKATPEINVHLHEPVEGGRILGNNVKELVLGPGTSVEQETFDFVINATYARYNTFCRWFGFAPRKFQYNLQELNVVELPAGFRAGATIMDGAYPSLIPMGGTPYHLLAHVEASQLVRESSEASTPLLGRVSSIESNWRGVLEASVGYLPILRHARYIKSLFVDRVVDAAASATDARLTEITSHESGCYSIFAAKLITCVSTAKKLASLLREAS